MVVEDLVVVKEMSDGFCRGWMGRWSLVGEIKKRGKLEEMVATLGL